MKLLNLFPPKELTNDLRNIESTLLSRKKNGKIAGIVALLSAFAQLIIISYPYLKQILDASYEFQISKYLNDPNKLIPLIGLVAGTLIYLLLRRTGFLIKETKEPFRYTCWVDAFAMVQDTPGDRFNLKADDRLRLLHHDLIELINQRIKRFSILEIPADMPAEETASITDMRKSSHIHIYGNYAIREDKSNDEWIVHVMPYVRIGPSGSPATMAQSVRYSLSTDDSPDELDTHEYNQLLERVYSRVTTEIYAQIEKDIQGKINLFPTSFLQANALYYEARDMAKSNTINAFESAIHLYEEAIRKINMTLIKRISSFFLKIPVVRSWFVQNLFQYARIQIGHAKCLVYKNRIAVLSGKKRNPVFEIRQDLKDVIRQLEYFHGCISGNRETSVFKKENEQTFSILAYLTYPNDTWRRRMLLKPSKKLFDDTRTILFNAYVVHSLTDTLLGTFLSAQNFLDKAKAIAPDRSASDPLYLLAQAYIEPDIDKALFLFQQATDKDPSFQIAQYDLAFWTEMKFRMNNEINHSRARIALYEYDKVLRINPGNIAALAAQGYIYWLLHDLDKARRKFEEGCELKTMVSETFIGQLLYGRARILVEEGRISEGFDLFNQAFATNPNLGTFSVGDNSWVHYSFYEFMTPQLLKRFREYYNRFSFYKSHQLFPVTTIADEFVASLDKEDFTDELISALIERGIIIEKERSEIRIEEKSNRWVIRDGKNVSHYLVHVENKIHICIQPDVSVKISDAVFSYALNDYGNANINFFKRYGDRDYLILANQNYSDSIKYFPHNSIAKYNQALTLYEMEQYSRSINLLKEVIKDNPKWFEASASSVEITQQKGYGEIKRNEEKLNKLLSEKVNLEKLRQIHKKSSQTTTLQSSKNLSTSLDEGKRSNPSDLSVKIEDQQEDRITGISNEISKVAQTIALLKEIPRDIENTIKNLFVPTKLISLYQGLELEHFESSKIERFINKKINWIRLDEDDVRALRIYAISFYYDQLKAKDDLSSQLTCKKFFDHFLTYYYPEDYTINVYKRELLSRIDGFDDEKINCSKIVASTINFWLQQDPVYFSNFDSAQMYLDPKTYFDLLDNAFRLESSKELAELILTIDYYHDRGLSGFIETFESSSRLNSEPVKRAFVYYRIGRLLADDKLDDEAVGYYKIATQLDTGNLVYWRNLGLSYFNLGEWDGLIHCFLNAIEIRRSTTEEYYGLDYYYDYLSEAYFNTGKLEAFLELFESSGDFVNEPVKKAIIYNRIGNLHYNSKKITEAISYYLKAVELDDSRPIYFSNLGLMYSSLLLWDESKDFYLRAIELRRETTDDPYGIDYYYEYLSEPYFNAGKLDEFIDLFEGSDDLLHEPVKKAIIYNRIGNLHFNLQKYKEAMPFYTKAIENDPARPIYLCNLGLSYSRLEQWNDAVKFHQQAVELRRTTPDDSYGLDYYYDFLSEAYFKTGRLPEFIEMMESSGDLKNEPEKLAVVYNRIGNLLVNSNQEKEAIAIYEKVIRLDPVRPIYIFNLGFTYAKSGDWNLALNYYLQAVELRRITKDDPYGLDYYFDYLSEAYWKTGNLSEFVEMFENSVELNAEPEKKATIYNGIGNFCYGSGQLKDAITFYSKAIELDPVRPIYYSNKGLMYASLGKWEEAVSFHKKAIELRQLAPNDPYEPDHYEKLLKEAQSQIGVDDSNGV